MLKHTYGSASRWLPMQHNPSATLQPTTRPRLVRALCGTAVLGLSLYSIALLCTEWTTSQEHVRNYFTDISGPVRFYAVNTSLSVFLLWATALLFVVCLKCTESTTGWSRLRLFYISQVLVFAFLGFDDRFGVHEWIGHKLDVADHYSLILIAVFQTACLLTLGRWLLRGRTISYLVLAAASFTVMLAVDALAPHDGFLRLSIEDLAKVWGAFFFFLVSWDQLTFALNELRDTHKHEVSTD